MDISILLALQEFRNGPGSIMADFFQKMTLLGENSSLFVFMAIFYWCISKELGVYFLMGFSGNRLVNGLLKVTVCSYRPWIRDPRIVPYGNAMAAATGYSFPSGHTANAATIFGGGVVRKDFPIRMRIILFLMVVLVAFSRLYLGVHTPQDVIVGAGTGFVVMWLIFKLMGWIERNPQKDILVVFSGIGITVALAIYASLKPYPADFDVEGKLIVDGAKMALDTFKAVGWVDAFLVGWILERRFVGFKTEGCLMKMLMRAAHGLLGYYLVGLVVVPLIKQGIPGAAGIMLSCFIQMFYVVFIFPWCLKYLEKPKYYSKQPLTH